MRLIVRCLEPHPVEGDIVEVTRVHEGFELLHVEPGFVSIRGGTAISHYAGEETPPAPSGPAVYSSVPFTLEGAEHVIRWGPMAKGAFDFELEGRKPATSKEAS